MPPTKSSDHAAKLLNQAFSHQQQGRLQEALVLYQQVLAAEPTNFLALDSLGTLHGQAGRFEGALNYFTQASLVQPNDFAVHFNLGMALKELKRYDEALASFNKAISLNPVFAEAYNNRGSVLKERKRYNDALISFDMAITLKPGFANACNNRGVLLLEIFKRYDEALVSFDKAIEFKPDFSEAHYNRGSALKELKRYQEALISFDKAIALNPGFANAYNNRGVILTEVFKRYSEALVCYEKTIKLRPDFAEAYYNRSSILLLLEDYKEGWPLYEWRWKTQHLKGYARNFKQPLWLGEPSIVGKTILLHAEQGLGDTIQCVRYVPLVERLGAKVVLEVPAVLAPLIRSLKGSFTLIASGDELPDFDLHCPLMSLPLAFRTTVDTIPAEVSYLAAVQKKQAEWHARLGEKIKLRIGLVWSGSKMHLNDRNRSIALRTLEPLLQFNFEYHSLQKEVGSDDKAFLANHTQIQTHENELHDFADTAALISELDLVIAVDTSVAHLAGALGKPVWILLPYAPDFRWMLERNDSPWYPTAHLFRQDSLGDWEGVIENVVLELRRQLI